MPAVEVGRLLVVVVEHLGEHLLVVGVAEGRRRSADPAFGVGFYAQVAGQVFRRRVGNALQIGHVTVFPAGAELLGDAPAALAEAGIADLTVVGEHLATRLTDGLLHMGRGLTRDALIALAVVVGADVEERVVLAVVPSYDGVRC